MLPGGLVEPGETLDRAVEREVYEETGVVASSRGICGVRSRFDGRRNDTYVIFLLDVVDGAPRSDGRENDEARYFSLDDLEDPIVTDLSAYFGRLALTNALTLFSLADDFDAAAGGRDPSSWKLFR
jgi:8-oxo-dGTP pyrophosphatase MutT (NUDIX family)